MEPRLLVVEQVACAQDHRCAVICGTLLAPVLVSSSEDRSLLSPRSSRACGRRVSWRRGRGPSRPRSRWTRRTRCRVVSTRSTSRRRTEIRRGCRGVLKRAADDLQINPDLSGLRFDQVKESVLGSHALVQQQHGGRPVSMGPRGYRPGRQGLQRAERPHPGFGPGAKAPAELAASGIAKEEAIAKALTATGSTGDSPHTIHSTEQVAYPVDGQPTPACGGRRRQAIG